VTDEYANPSADKFGPPPGEERFEAPSVRPRRAWFAAALWVAYILVRADVPVHGKTWPIALTLITLFATVEYVIKRVARHQRDVGIADQGMGPGIGDQGSGI